MLSPGPSDISWDSRAGYHELNSSSRITGNEKGRKTEKRHRRKTQKKKTRMKGSSKIGHTELSGVDECQREKSQTLKSGSSLKTKKKQKNGEKKGVVKAREEVHVWSGQIGGDGSESSGEKKVRQKRHSGTRGGDVGPAISSVRRRDEREGGVGRYRKSLTSYSTVGWKKRGEEEPQRVQQISVKVGAKGRLKCEQPN